ncbi:MAG TPA: WS/DGAT domain-containing protein [Streptosporangiaceae bacterium]
MAVPHRCAVAGCAGGVRAVADAVEAASPLIFAGAPVRAVIAIPNTTGNVTVTFGALSYGGTLRITVLSDPSRVPDVAVLTAALRRDLRGAAH